MSFLRQGKTSKKTIYKNVIGHTSTQHELTKLFKPVTDMQTDLKEGIVSELKSIREGMKKFTKGYNISTISVYNSLWWWWRRRRGDIAEEYLRKFATVSSADKTFGLRNKDGRFYIGNKEAKIMENNIIVGNEEYTGTPGLWKRIVARSPDDKISLMGIMIIMLK